MGLQYLHGAGIIHGSLNPLTVVVQGGQALLIDAGLSSLHTDDPTQTCIDTSFETYQAPEIASGEKEEGDTRSDVYSWAAISLLIFLPSECDFHVFPPSECDFHLER